MQTETIQIHTEFIKLQDLLKFAGAVEIGRASCRERV